MANTIIDISGNKSIEMVNARFARKPIAGLFASGAWTKIRVALYLDCVTGSSITNASFWFGLCSGTTNIPGDTTPTNAIGLWSLNPGTLTYNNSGGSTLKIYNTFYPRKSVGGVETSGTAFTTNLTAISSSFNSSGPGCLFCDIVKGSPNYTMNAFFLDRSAVTSMNEAAFETQSIAATPSGSGHVFETGKALAFDESAGTLDSAFVYWSSSVALRIFQWRVIKLA